MTVRGYSSWPWKKNGPREDLIIYVVYWTFVPMHIYSYSFRGAFVERKLYMNLFNFLTSLGKQWSLPLPNWSVAQSFLKKLKLLTSGKISIGFLGKISRRKFFRLKSFYWKLFPQKKFPAEEVFTGKSFRRKFTEIPVSG